MEPHRGGDQGDAGAVLCVGGANIDTKIRSLAPIRPATSNPSRITRSCGGVARNVAANLALLRLPVSLLAFTGDDSESDWLLQQTARLGVDCRACTSLSDFRTGNYTAFLDSDGELFVAAVDMTLYDRLSTDSLKNAWNRCAPSAALFLDTNLPAPALEFVITESRKRALPLIVDPVSVSKSERLPRNLEGITWLLPNWDEAVRLAGLDCHGVNDPAEICSRILERGAEGVIITLGSRGIAGASRTGFQCRLPASTTTIVDVTGAGDAWAAGFLFGMMTGQLVSLCCRLGMGMSRLTLGSPDSICSDLSPEKLHNSVREWESETEIPDEER